MNTSTHSPAPEIKSIQFLEFNPLTDKTFVQFLWIINHQFNWGNTLFTEGWRSLQPLKRSGEEAWLKATADQGIVDAWCYRKHRGPVNVQIHGSTLEERLMNTGWSGVLRRTHNSRQQKSAKRERQKDAVPTNGQDRQEFCIEGRVISCSNCSCNWKPFQGFSSNNLNSIPLEFKCILPSNVNFC